MKKPELPTLPAMPGLPTLATLPTLPTELPKLKTLAEIEAENENPLDRNNEHYTGNAETDALLDMQVIDDEFAAIREARKSQDEAIALANDSEFWFCMYFQTREQKEAFLHALKLTDLPDKYINGVEAAAVLAIELPKRPAPYKVGRVDKKLAEIAQTSQDDIE